MKKLIAIVLSSLLLIGAAVGGTLALASDEERSINVYTAGNINIALKNGDTTNLDLFPAVYNFSVPEVTANPWALNEQGLWKHIRNAHTLNIGVDNVGKNDAYVRVIIAYENPELANGGNFYDLLKLNKISDTNVEEAVVAERIEIDGVDYKIVSYTFLNPIQAGKSSATVLSQLALKTETTSEQMAAIGDNFNLLVCAQAVQVDGTNGAKAMLNAAFPNAHPWVNWVEPNNPGTLVATASQLQTALEKGGKVTLTEDIKLTESLVIPAPAAATYSLRSVPAATILNLNGKKITGELTKENGALIINNGILVINGDENTVIKNTKVNGSAVILNNGNLVINGGSYIGAPSDTAEGTASYAINTQGAGAELTVNNASVFGRGVIGVTGGAKATLNGGTYHTPAVAWGHAVYANDEGTEVVINGGTFSEGYEESPNNWGMYQIYSGQGAKVTVYGGKFMPWDCANGYDLCTATNGVIKIFGGTFAEDPSKQNNINYVAEGYAVIQNADGTYTVIFPQTSFDSLISNAQAGDTVEIPAGTYKFPASELKAGVTIVCDEGTVFDGKTGLNINGATVVGATFTNNNDYLVNNTTINGTFQNCVFTNCDGLRSCYAGETVVFENCVFDTDFYGVHFDSGANDVVFKNCTFTGFNTFGAEITKLTMEGCTFKYNGKGGYNGLNLWGNAELTNCTFVFDGSASYEWVDLRNDNQTVTFTNCVVTDGKKETAIENVVGNYGTGNTITIDGEKVAIASDAKVFADAVANGATKIYLSAGEYDLNGNQKDGLKLIGQGNGVKLANTTKYAGGKATGAIWHAISLENVTITNTVYTMDNGGKSTFTNVTFAAGFRQGYGTGVVFTDCTFGSNSEGYALHFQTDNASESGLITLNGCEFEGGKVHLGGKRAYAFTNCDFAEGTDFQVWSTITLKGCTVDGVAITNENIATFFPKLDIAKVTLN